MTGRLLPATVCFSSNAASVHTALPRAVAAYLQACLDHIDASDQGNVIPRSSAINEFAKHAAKSSLKDFWIPYPKASAGPMRKATCPKRWTRHSDGDYKVCP